MKHLRVWLMLLLVVVLPVRGAMAAAMLCLPQDGPQSQEVMVQHLGGDSSNAHDHAQHGHGHHGRAQLRRQRYSGRVRTMTWRQ